MRAAAQNLAPVVGIARACAVLGVPRSSFYHAQRVSTPSAPRTRPTPAHALSATEQQTVRDVLNDERFVDCAPRTVVAIVLDEGRYLCAWRTMYRILAQDAATRERRAQRRHPCYAAPEVLATGPGQVWSWDITKLRGPAPGIWYNLYVIIDIFSRAIVGWLIADREDADLAEALFAKTYQRQGIRPRQLTVHADRGAPMRANTLGALFQNLGVTASHSRPTVSNDNPYSEAQFKTMKYSVHYPERFESLTEARRWMRRFVAWYNYEHRHSGIAMLPPTAVHTGAAAAQLTARQAVLDAAYAAHPYRFVKGAPQIARLPDQVGINVPPTVFAALPPLLAGQGPAAGPPPARLDQKQGRLRTPTLPNFVESLSKRT